MISHTSQTFAFGTNWKRSERERGGELTGKSRAFAMGDLKVAITQCSSLPAR